MTYPAALAIAGGELRAIGRDDGRHHGTLRAPALLVDLVRQAEVDRRRDAGVASSRRRAARSRNCGVPLRYSSPGRTRPPERVRRPATSRNPSNPGYLTGPTGS